ncbi:MAG: ribosome recycling factor [Dehalococcoidia bacterium]|nr:ribosome recycling factor [Dehalococcoidia bacterium]MBF8303944.1 ribosome recycling factor [Dehalococcoidia bacterium]
MSQAKTNKEILVQCEAQMQRAVDAIRRELASLRTSRASPALVEHIRVDYHGVPTPINQLATISTPEARLLLIQPWDRSSVGTIEKAILKSDLSLTPSNDGNVIRLVIPILTEERRLEMVRLVNKRVEQARVELRNMRRDSLEDLRKIEKAKSISADELKRSTDQLQKLIDRFTEEANRVGKQKEVELLES